MTLNWKPRFSSLCSICRVIAEQKIIISMAHILVEAVAAVTRAALTVKPDIGRGGHILRRSG